MSSHERHDRTPSGEDPQEQHGRTRMVLGMVVLLLVVLAIFAVMGLVL